jgi:hypothetical protein
MAPSAPPHLTRIESSKSFWESEMTKLLCIAAALALFAPAALATLTQAAQIVA